MSGQRRYRCWIPAVEAEIDGAIIWRKRADSAASEHAATRWQHTNDLGPYEVHTRNAQKEESVFTVTMSVVPMILKGGREGHQLKTVTGLKRVLIEAV